MSHSHRPYHRSTLVTMLALLVLIVTQIALLRFCDAYTEATRDRPNLESSWSQRNPPGAEQAMARVSPAESLCLRGFDHAILGLFVALVALLVALGLDLGGWSERLEWAETLATRLQLFGRFIALLGLGLAILVLWLTSQIEFRPV